MTDVFKDAVQYDSTPAVLAQARPSVPHTQRLSQASFFKKHK